MSGFPRMPIRIVTTDPGTHLDMLARLIADGISGPLGQPVSVENYPGMTPGIVVSKASADGCTLLVTGGNLWYARLIKETPYDPVHDFSPITLATISPLLFVINPALQANSVKDVIALAKAKPGQLSYASGLPGHSSQLAGGLFTSMAGVDIVRVSCKGSGLEGIDDLIAGKVQMMIPSAAAVMKQVALGKVRALAVTSARPSALFPDLPTVAASGLPDYEIVQSIAVFAPANTPATVIKRLNQEIVSFLQTSDISRRLLNAGLEVVGSLPEELSARVAMEMTRWSKVVREANIRSE
jgi:tripartite-type tricarboxylate transporter receptor subunit TctC